MFWSSLILLSTSILCYFAQFDFCVSANLTQHRSCEKKVWSHHLIVNEKLRWACPSGGTKRGPSISGTPLIYEDNPKPDLWCNTQTEISGRREVGKGTLFYSRKLFIYWESTLGPSCSLKTNVQKFLMCWKAFFFSVQQGYISHLRS